MRLRVKAKENVNEKIEEGEDKCATNSNCFEVDFFNRYHFALYCFSAIGSWCAKADDGEEIELIKIQREF